MHKRTNIELDIDLLNEAMKITKLSTIKEVVHFSLMEMIKVKKRRGILKLKGKVDWEGNLDEMRSV